MTDRPRVAIIGGGLGGLCLAQGLRRQGVPVTVYERDAGAVFRDQGYRIHIGPEGTAALEECLPAALHELFLATAGRTGRQVTVVSKGLRTLKVFPAGSGGSRVSVPVNRLTLREVLLAGLQDIVCFDHEFRYFERTADTIHVHFSRGDPVEADVLVGADGVGSAVRRQLLPQARVTDTGTKVIYGKTPLDHRARAMLPPPVHDGFVAVAAFPRPVGMALGLLEFAERPPEAAARLWPGLRMHDCADYLMWALSAPTRAFPVADVCGLDGVELSALATRMTRHWHPRLRGLVDSCAAGETFALAVRTSTPIPPWRSSRVTVLGDAVHAMSPAGGSGATTALRDAALLSGMLAADPGDPVAAIARYEHAMVDYGFTAVRASQQAERRFRR